MLDTATKEKVRKSIVFVNKAINIIVLSVIIGAIGISIYALTDIRRVIVDGAPTQYAIYKPREDRGSFEELIKINPEVIGWINIYGTEIDYPITQADDNRKYLSTSATLKYSLLGSIFLDCDNKPDFSDFNNILYGHNMTPRAMFGNVKDFRDEAYFEAHKYGDLFYNNTHYGLQIFAVFREDGYSSFLTKIEFKDDADRQQYLDDIYAKSVITRDVGVGPSDRIVMMYTCSNVTTNGRDLLVARITDNTYADPFDKGEVDTDRFRRLKEVPLWLWPYLILIILLLILLWVKRAGARRENKRRKKIMANALKQAREENKPKS